MSKALIDNDIYYRNKNIHAMVAIQLKYEMLSKNSGNLPKTLHNFEPVDRFQSNFYL